VTAKRTPESLTFTPRDGLPPANIDGYVRDGNTFTRVWAECSHRAEHWLTLACGKITLRARCLCADCPLVGLRVRLADCQDCEHK
jgi:hypothetical protein